MLQTPLSESVPVMRSAVERLVSNLETVIVGKQAAIRLILVGLLCDGHILLEDVPGVGKTLLAKALARSIDGKFQRIQCTPDLLPSGPDGHKYLEPAGGSL